MRMPEHKKRYSNEPAPGREAPIRQLREFHLDVLRLLTPTDRYTYLPWPWIYALHGLKGKRHSQRFRTELQHMAEKPNYYLSVPQQHTPPGTNTTRHAVYTLAPAGAKALHIEPRRPPHEYHHQLIQDVTKASIELGCASRGITFLDWAHLKDHDDLKGKSWWIPIDNENSYEPDGPPIILRYGQGNYRYLFTEIDRGTEPLTTKVSRRNITSLFEEIGAVMKQRLYEKHFDFESALFLIVTISEKRMDSMMQVAAEVLGTPTYVLFKTTEEWQRDANDNMLATPWKRVGHPEFDLSTWS